MLIRLAHSPDADDAFMFYAIACGKIPTGNFKFQHVFSDIETLNLQAMQGRYEVTAVSLHAFAYITDQYWLLPNGASIGKGYGPILVAKKAFAISELPNLTIAVPGTYTTAQLALNLAIGKFAFKVIPFDRIIPAVMNEEVEAGLIIHEGQLTYASQNLVKNLDLGEWWERETGLPLPLGVDAVRQDLGKKTAKQLSDILEASIRYAMEHEDEALDYALQFGRALEREKARKFVRMYVNERTLRYSEEERKAVCLLLDEGFRKGLLPKKPEITFAW